MKFSGLTLSVATALSATLTQAHTWITCTDYKQDGLVPTAAFDRSKCNNAYPYGLPNIATATPHGGDVAFDASGAAAVGASIISQSDFGYHRRSKGCAQGDLTGQYVAKYTAGQRVTFSHPPKNHVTDTCKPMNGDDDLGNVIARTAAGGKPAGPWEKEYTHLNGIHTSGQRDYKGFQNCYNFCGNKEGALCTMSFDLEKDIAPGHYVFRWTWTLSPLDRDIYTQCWEADVVAGNSTSTTGADADAASPTTAPAAATTSTPSTATTTSAPATSSSAAPGGRYPAARATAPSSSSTGTGSNSWQRFYNWWMQRNNRGYRAAGK